MEAMGGVWSCGTRSTASVSGSDWCRLSAAVVNCDEPCDCLSVLSVVRLDGCAAVGCDSVVGGIRSGAICDGCPVVSINPCDLIVW